jgi:hypothetical protein
MVGGSLAPLLHSDRKVNGFERYLPAIEVDSGATAEVHCGMCTDGFPGVKRAHSDASIAEPTANVFLPGNHAMTIRAGQEGVGDPAVKLP